MRGLKGMINCGGRGADFGLKRADGRKYFFLGNEFMGEFYSGFNCNYNLKHTKVLCTSRIIIPSRPGSVIIPERGGWICDSLMRVVSFDFSRININAAALQV